MIFESGKLRESFLRTVSMNVWMSSVKSTETPLVLSNSKPMNQIFSVSVLTSALSGGLSTTGSLDPLVVVVVELVLVVVVIGAVAVSVVADAVVVVVVSEEDEVLGRPLLLLPLLVRSLSLAVDAEELAVDKLLVAGSFGDFVGVSTLT